MKETWRDAVGFPGYMVSDEGRVKSVARTVLVPGPKGGNRSLRTRILKPTLLASGYTQVNPSVHGKTKKITVHRLVAIAFLGPPPFKRAHVNHINNKKAVNRLTNLEWTSASGNALHSFRTTSRVSSAKGKFGAKNPSSIPVIATCMKTGKVRRYAAAADATRRGFESGGISVACSGKRPHYKGYYWRYERGYGRGGTA